MDTDHAVTQIPLNWGAAAIVPGAPCNRNRALAIGAPRRQRPSSKNGVHTHERTDPRRT